jgi:tetratricopeptide (TPR) repeat protein
MRDFNAVITDLNKAIGFNIDLPVSYSLRGYAKFMLRYYEGAISDLTKAIELNPANDETYNLRARVYYLQKNKDAACADWTKAASLGNKEAAFSLKQFCEKTKTVHHPPGWVEWH